MRNGLVRGNVRRILWFEITHDGYGWNLHGIFSIFRPFAARRHLHQPGHEFTEHGHQVFLSGHDVADILVSHWHFVQAGADKRHALLFKKTVHVLPIKFLVRRLAAHGATGAVRSRIERLGLAFAADDEARRGHGTGNNTQHARAGRCGAFAMHNDLALDAINDMLLFPRKVVMVLQVQQHLRAEMLRNMAMDAGVICRRIAAHQFHGIPIFLALLRIEREPGETLQLARQIGKLTECKLAVVVADRCAGTYLRQKSADEGWEQAEGVLLYPRTTRDVDVEFVTHGHRIRALTLNLVVRKNRAAKAQR